MEVTIPRSQTSRSGDDSPTVIDAHGVSPFGALPHPPVDPLSAMELAKNFKGLRSSGPPARIMFHSGGAWASFPRDAFETLRAEFVRRRATARTVVVIDGLRCLVDFLRMLLTNLDSGEMTSIAWIDVKGRCFFPKAVVGDDKGGVFPKLHNGGTTVQPLLEEYSDETPEVSSGVGWSSGVQSVDRDDRYFGIIERIFLSGTTSRGSVAPAITSISRCTHSGPLADVRLKDFQSRIKHMNGIRGNANVRGGWYVGLPGELDDVVKHGFGQPNSGLFPMEPYGTGVYLIPPQTLHTSPYAFLGGREDGNGEQHVLFCRVIMGKPEKVPRGSRQYHPSSHQFDSGMDDLQNPKWYIVWSTHMNTHVIPECIVSFRPLDHHQPPRGVLTRKATHAKKSSPWSVQYTLLQLFAEIGKMLPPSKMKTLDMLFERYKAQKMQKEDFIRYVRSIAGTKVLTEAIKKLRRL